MKKIKITQFGIFTAIAFFIGCFSVQAQNSLTIVGFGGSLQDAQREAYFQPFSKTTKIKLTEDSYGGGISKIKAMVDTGSVIWDVVQMDENEMTLACEQGLLEPISAEELGLAKDLLRQAKSAECGIGFFVWSMVLSYDKDKLKNMPAKWSDMWNLKKWPGKRGLRKQARMTLEIALLGDGVPPKDVYKVLSTEKGVKRAFAKLDKIKDYIIWWETGAQPTEWIASGDLVMSAAYNGRVSNANNEGKNFAIVWENQIYGMDFWTIVKGGNVKNGKKFIRFAMSPENQKAFTDQIPYGVTNTKANALIDKKVANSLPTTPKNLSGALSISNDFWVDHEEELQIRFTRWLAQ